MRDNAARGLMPTYDARHDCMANLLLASGMSADAAFRLVVETYQLPVRPGEYRQGERWTTAPLGLEEAERQICALRPCE